ncbi:DUF2382 domain-containing protein [Egbenema bharatensis]|uniref:DUF2382 domain-containing protein n=1 Tax=Egbenema bharatensis TaxID=3463334 RepID=UPI003A8AF66E
MPLHKIRDFAPDYRDYFGDHDIIGYSLYSGDDKVGSVDDLLVDDAGKFRYLVVNTGAWIFGKKVLLPIGRTRMSYSDKRVYVDGLTRNQVENLPEYDGQRSLDDFDQEERVRGVYRNMGSSSVENSTAVESGAPVDPTRRGTAATQNRGYDRNTYNYDRDPALYNMNEQNHQNLRLYEERLIANRVRRKTGEVAVGKHVETEQANVSVPVEKERVVIERGTPTDAGRAVNPGAEAFKDGEAVRMDVYEETPDIRKEAYVREEVRVRKEVDRDTVEANETIRKERLDIDKEGRVIDGPADPSVDRSRDARSRDARPRDRR